MRIIILIPVLMLVLAFHASGQYLQVFDSLLFDAKYDQAIELIDAQLKKTPGNEVRLALENKKAEVLTRAGKFKEAELLLETLKTKASTPYQKAILQTNYGSLYLNQGKNDESLESLKEAIHQFNLDTKDNSLETAQTLALLGNLYRATGKYVQAEEQLTRALAIRQKYFKENNEAIAASYNDLGLVYSQLDHDKALEYYEKAEKIYERLHGKDHPKIAIANTNIGFMYSRLELYGDAINNFESALKIWEKIYPGAHPTKGFVLFNLGETYQKLENQKAAIGYYERALGVYEKSYGKKHPDIATVLNAIGTLRLSDGKFDDALFYYQKALLANVVNFNSEELNANPNLESFYNGNTLLYSLLNKARGLEDRYYGKTLKLKDLQLAVCTLQACDTLIDRLRQHITNESDKIALGVIASDVYANGVRIAYETGQVDIKRKKWNALAFYFAEKSKSAVLLEAISDVNAKSFAGIPDHLLQEERNLKAAIALTAQQLAQKPSEQEERKLRENAFSLNRTYEAFTKQLETKFPEYFNLKYNTAAPTISDLQSRMDSKTAIISYFVDETINHVYTFLITKSNYRIFDREVPVAFDKYITGLRNGLYFNAGDAYREAAENLSSYLIPKRIPPVIKDLVIIPTGRLSIVPFETLFTAKIGKNNANSDLPYLLDKYNVRYEFSAALILQKAIGKINQEASVLLCAPVIFPQKDQLADLPGTEQEVKDVAEQFTAHKLRSSVFVRDQADEKLAKSGILKNYKYLHFATHGIVDENSPELSKIFLQANAGDDGNLFAGEIYNLELNADLVTLSACQTGLGKISKGEGVIGLSRALVYAGARNIIVSFWSVADESTAMLMTAFYKEMLEHTDRNLSENLRAAKLELIKTEKFNSPFYWAPFVLIGF